MFKYKFTLSIGYSNASHKEIMEYDEEPSEDELEEDWTQWTYNFIDGGYEQVEL